MELLDHRLIKILNLHRTLSGSAKSIQDLAVVLVKTIGLEMARREDQRFTYMSAGVIELLGSGMADLESLIFQKAVDIANANTGVKLTAPIIRGLMAEHIGPVGTATGMMKSSRLTRKDAQKLAYDFNHVDNSDRIFLQKRIRRFQFMALAAR